MRLSFPQINALAQGQTVALTNGIVRLTVKRTPEGYLVCKNGLVIKLIPNWADLLSTDIYPVDPPWANRLSDPWLPANDERTKSVTSTDRGTSQIVGRDFKSQDAPGDSSIAKFEQDAASSAQPQRPVERQKQISHDP